MSKDNLVVDRDKRAIIMSRVFDAPRELVWRVVTDPALIPEWWGPRSTKTVVDKMDVRVGGVWRYIHYDGEGNEMGFNGVYKEITPPERITYTFEFEPMAGNIALETITLEEMPAGKTKIITSTVYDSMETVEAVIQSGMEGGASESWDRLEELLVKVGEVSVA